MSRRHIEDLANAVPLTVAGGEALLDTADLSPRQRRNLTRQVGEARQRMQGYQNERIRAANTDLQRRYDELDDQVMALASETRKINARLRKGRLSTAEGRKALAEVGAATRVIRERTEQLAADEAALKELAAKTPAQYEQELLAKFPALAAKTPVLRPSDLNQP
jgi:predicted  nucleic acid-binding Zn-ribbon protein